jgi:hypothetical protein
LPRPKRDVESALLKKGFKQREGDHHQFIYFGLDGKKTPVVTKTSHTQSMKDIPDPLLSQMAKQCRLSKGELLSLVDCPLSRDDYHKLLDSRGCI